MVIFEGFLWFFQTFLTILPLVIIMGGGGGQILTRTTKIGPILKTKSFENRSMKRIIKRVVPWWKNGSFKNKNLTNVIVIQNSLNPKGHQNPISGSKVTVILLKPWILPIGGASSGGVCAYSLRSRLVLTKAELSLANSNLPEPSQSRILTLFPSLVEPAPLEHFGSRKLEIQSPVSSVHSGCNRVWQIVTDKTSSGRW